MRRHRRDWFRLAAWLGVIALGLNALVPIHLAFDLAEAFAPAPHAPAAATGLDWQIFAFLSGHGADGDHDQDHHQHDGKPGRHDCPVCAVAGTLVALSLPAVAALPVPAAAALRLAVHTVVAAPPAILAAAYRSRAPPLT